MAACNNKPFTTQATCHVTHVTCYVDGCTEQQTVDKATRYVDGCTEQQTVDSPSDPLRGWLLKQQTVDSPSDPSRGCRPAVETANHTRTRRGPLSARHEQAGASVRHHRTRAQGILSRDYQHSVIVLGLGTTKLHDNERVQGPV